LILLIIILGNYSKRDLSPSPPVSPQLRTSGYFDKKDKSDLRRTLDHTPTTVKELITLFESGPDSVVLEGEGEEDPPEEEKM
jgi:hypothetical protein